jgi:hypothetical protein
MIRELCVCIPARNEAERIGALLAALASQDINEPFHVALCVNNSDDGTAQIAAAAAAAGVPFTLHLHECHFDAEEAHAGSARRAAMDLGAEVLGRDDALLISTDADCRPPSDWLAANIASCEQDAIVGGRIMLDEEEADRSPALRDLHRRFDAYWEQVRAIEDSVDPVPWEAPHRHGDHTGASLALSVGLYRRAGGVPLIPVGEDRALVAAVIAQGGRLIHPRNVWVRVSPRLAGRAPGGMAHTLAQWMDGLSKGETPYVPAYSHWEQRGRWRKALRDERGHAALISAEQQLPAMPCDMLLPRADPA